MGDNVFYRLIIFLVGTVIFIVYVKDFIKEIKTWWEIKPSIKDNMIDAIVIRHIPCMNGDVKPVLVYRVDAIESEYIYHFYCNPKQYPIGESKLLKCSLKSELAYDRKDLLKSLLYFMLGICFGGGAMVIVVYAFLLGI